MAICCNGTRSSKDIRVEKEPCLTERLSNVIKFTFVLSSIVLLCHSKRNGWWLNWFWVLGTICILFSYYYLFQDNTPRCFCSTQITATANKKPKKKNSIKSVRFVRFIHWDNSVDINLIYDELGLIHLEMEWMVEASGVRHHPRDISLEATTQKIYYIEKQHIWPMIYIILRFLWLWHY